MTAKNNLWVIRYVSVSLRLLLKPFPQFRHLYHYQLAAKPGKKGMQHPSVPEIPDCIHQRILPCSHGTVLQFYFTVALPSSKRRTSVSFGTELLRNHFPTDPPALQDSV